MVQTVDNKVRRRPLRVRFLALHQWLGAITCLYMALLMATGSLSVFDREIDRFLSTEVAPEAAPVASFGAAYDRMHAAFETPQVVRIEREGGYWAALVDGAGGRHHVFIDARSGAVSTLAQNVSVQRIVRDLHANLMVAHPVARLAVTAFGFVLLWQVISGLWAYRRFWRGFLRLPSGQMTGQGWWGAAHRLAGLWALPVILVAALTSVIFFAEVFGFHPKELKGAAAAERTAPLPEGFDGAALDGVVATAQGAIAGFEVRELALPGVRKAVFKLDGSAGALLAKPEVTRVLVDPATGAVLGQRAASDLGLAGRVYAAAVPLHYGNFGGVWSKVFWLLGGVLGTVLALSGAIIAAHRAGQRGGMGTIWRGVPIIGRLGLIGALLLAIAMYVVRYT